MCYQLRVYIRIAILYVIKNYEYFMAMEKIKEKWKQRTFIVKVNYSRKSLSRKFVDDHLDPKYFNLMPIHIKKHVLHDWESSS